MSSDTQKKVLTDILQNAGREMSTGWIEKAVTTAKDSKQMSNQIFILRSAAISILAHEAFNHSDALGIPLETYTEKLIRAFKAECKMLSDASDQMEKVKVGEKP